MNQPHFHNPYRLCQVTHAIECAQWEIDENIWFVDYLERESPQCTELIRLIKEQLIMWQEQLECAVNRPEAYDGESLVIHLNQVGG